MISKLILSSNEIVTGIINTEAEFLNEIQTNFLRVFLLAIFTVTSTLYSFALRFIFLLTHATSLKNSCNLWRISTVNLLYTVKEKGGNLIENHTPLPMVKEIHAETSSPQLSRLCPEASTNLYINEFVFWRQLWLVYEYDEYMRHWRPVYTAESVLDNGKKRKFCGVSVSYEKVNWSYNFPQKYCETVPMIKPRLQNLKAILSSQTIPKYAILEKLKYKWLMLNYW